jgi:hypothetical protein
VLARSLCWHADAASAQDYGSKPAIAHDPSSLKALSDHRSGIAHERVPVRGIPIDRLLVHASFRFSSCFSSQKVWAYQECPKPSSVKTIGAAESHQSNNVDLNLQDDLILRDFDNPAALAVAN